MRWTAAALLTAACSLPACSPPGAAPAQTPAAGDAAATVLDHARSLPPLVADAGELTIPLAGAEPHPWRPIREGISVTGGPALTVAYTRTRSQPAGAALVIRPGDLAGLRGFSIAVRGNRSQSLALTLTQTDGSVWTTAPVRLAEGEVRTVNLEAGDVTLDPYQNGGGGAHAAAFDPAAVYMLTLLDIGGYMSLTEPRCEWSVESMKAVLR